MMLCCLHDGFNGTVGLSLSQVFLESISEDGQLAICQSALNVDPLSAPKNDPPFVLSWPAAA